MARRVEVTRKATIADLAQRLAEPDFILVRATYLVHERTTHGRPCPCCSSDTCAVTERLPGPDLLIDTVGGSRWLRHEMFRDAA